MRREIEYPACPSCGESPVEWKRQVVTHDRPWKVAVECEPGEARFICPNGHHYTKDGEPRGNSMPPDITIRHDPMEALRGTD